MEKLLQKLGLDENTSNAILKEFNKVEKDLLETQTQLKNKADELQTLERFKTDYEELKPKFDTLNADYEAFKVSAKADVDKLNETLINTIKEHGIKTTLLKNGVEYADLLLEKFDKSALKVNKNNIVEGIEAQFEKLKEQYPKLCEAPQPKVQGAIPTQNTLDPQPQSFVNMTAEEVANMWGKFTDKYK